MLTCKENYISMIRLIGMEVENMEYIGLPDLSRDLLNDEIRNKLIELIEANKKIEAIKILRDRTGMVY